MNKIDAIIVDDEQSARDVLSNLLGREGSIINVIGTSSNVPDAAEKIKALKPAVVFLDVEMPNYAGYEIADFFEEIDFEIIFVTAFDQYAIKAFELSAVDYLIKPINRMRLEEAVNKLKDKVEQKKTIGNYQVLLESIKQKTFEKIVIPEAGNRRVLLLKDIISIEGEGAYSTIHLHKDKPIMVSKNLKYFETVLPDNSKFFRPHKSWIINLDHITSYNKGKSQIEMTDGISAKLSKHRKTEFEQKLTT
ncbi:MAG: DNA-binding response regulator [Flavobacteriales bacterium]|nr:MAG: DNA-binding response regulator [Flavobacteriales bacterium]